MAVIQWVNSGQNFFSTASDWSGGVVPGTADTAVIGSTSADGAPAAGPVTLLTPTSADSIAFLLPSTLAPLDKSLSQDTVVYTTSATGAPEAYETTPATAPTGDVFTGGTIDLIGGGSEAGVVLQNTTLGAKVAVNISGDAYAYAGYTNTLAGTIDIGLPFTIPGVTVPTPPADANGHVNALYLDIRPYGSWTNSVLNGYVPGVTNTGTIAIGASSSLVLSIAGEVQGSNELKGVTYLDPAEVSAFTNKGIINVEAGGSIHALSQYGQGEFINNGIISVAGSSAEKSGIGIQTIASGTGTIVLAGAAQSLPTQTVVEFTDKVSGMTFDLNDGTLILDAGSYITPTGLTCTGGTVSFTGSNGILQIDTPIIIENTATKTPPVNTVFSDTISGFEKGDQIQLSISLVPGNTPVATELSWDQTSSTAGTLDVSIVTKSSLGTTTTQEAALSLQGKYTSADFSASVSGTVSYLPTLTIETSVAAAAASALLPGDWSAASELGLTGNTMHGTANTSLATDDVTAVAHLDVLTHEHVNAGFHLHA
jgi:hypothetical protein